MPAPGRGPDRDNHFCGAAQPGEPGDGGYRLLSAEDGEQHGFREGLSGTSPSEPARRPLPAAVPVRDGFGLLATGPTGAGIALLPLSAPDLRGCSTFGFGRQCAGSHC
jgi:hypothetical protein